MVDRKQNLEIKNNIPVSLLSITQFITPEDLEKLKTDIQTALELSISKRKAAMVAYKTGSISKEERKNYMLDPTTQAITSGITNFFDTYFASHPEFDISKKDEIVNFYVKQAKLVTTALTAAKNPKEQEAAKEKIITTFLDSFENNPELRDVQITALKDDLYVWMNDISRIDLPVK